MIANGFFDNSFYGNDPGQIFYHKQDIQNNQQQQQQQLQQPQIIQAPINYSNKFNNIGNELMGIPS